MRPIIILFLFCFYFYSNSQNTVYVKVVGGKEGKGILKSRGNECFVITPKHVVKESFAGIQIIGDKKVKSAATIEHQYADDIAIVRVETGGIQKCTDWNVEQDFGQIIDNNTSGFVESREPDGTIAKTDIEIIGVNGEEIQIQRKDPMSIFMEGWSGSSLFVTQGGKKTYLGMLTNIQGRQAYVLRADHMTNVMKSFFGDDLNSEVEDDQQLVTNSNTSKSGVLAEMVTKQIKMTVTKFEQMNSKALFTYSMTNLDPTNQSINYSTHSNFFKLIDQNGLPYENPYFTQGGKNKNEIELIYNVPVTCTVEFEVGMNKITKAAKLQINGYHHEFVFYNLGFSDNNAKIINSKAETKNNTVLLATQLTKQIKLDVLSFNQVNNKAIFKYTLTNLNPSNQSINFNTHGNFFKLIDQNGIPYDNPYFTLGGSNQNNIELIYNVPVQCSVEFEVGMNKITKVAKLQLNGYHHEFVFINMSLTAATNSGNKSINLTKGLGNMELENIKISIIGMEQFGSKLIIRYSYENRDGSNQVKNISTHLNFNSIKINKIDYPAKYVSLGNSESSAELIYSVPVSCYAEFDIGATQITKIDYLKLGLYNHDFEFVGKGKINEPEFTFKSKKAIDDRNSLIFGGAALLIESVTKKKN
jgi:hypothetical protein